MEQVIVRDGEEHHPDCIEQPFHKHLSVERAALIKLTKYGILFLALVILPKMRRCPFSFGRNLDSAAITHFFGERKLPLDPATIQKFIAENWEKVFAKKE
jgi:hypothetical protein